MTSGGENPRPPRAIVVVQAGEPLFEEAFAPLGDHFAATVQVLGNPVVSPSIGSQEDHLGPLNLKIRQRIFSGSSLQLSGFIGDQLDSIWALPRHASRPPRQIGAL
jgi:hypothetical protein